MTLIMLVAVAAVPLRPTDTLLFGFLMESVYVILALTAHNTHGAVGVNALYVLFIFMLTMLATGLTAVVYEQRRSTYEWHLRSLGAADDLRQAEARNLLAQNAASVGRLAAALSHELNSPIGALVSGVDTLLLLASRQATAPPDQQQRLVLLQNELRKSIKQSTDRLKEIVTRMQRFTNLDRAEVQSANVNGLLTDVAALLEPQFKDKAVLEMRLQTVPELICRPQQLSAVFSSLLLNSVEARDADGRVIISTHAKNAEVEILICDNGRGLEPAELASIFDPGFKVANGRVSTGNWGLFSSRQIIREHGGDIAIESSPGEGTCVRIGLPCTGCGGLEKPS
jgi:signal transduction histidine kinase